MTSTIITPELLKSDPFIWDIEKQTPPPERHVCIDATRPSLWGNITLAVNAALRCGSQVSVIATGHELGAFALALPESTFVVDIAETGESSVCCFLEIPQEAPSRSSVIVAQSNAALPEKSIGITNQSLENTPLKSTFVGGWPQLKVLFSDGNSFGLEARSAKDGPQPFVTGSEYVLAGIVSSLLSRGLSANAAAVWGIYLFHLTIEAAAKDLGSEGVRASDLIARLPGSLRYATRYADTSVAVRSGLRPQ
ncbi:MAG: hypothetical protein ABI210_10175 [Abditibacteriaceae bacterium]